MPFDRLHVQNFQKHEDRTIVLDPQVTTIIGPSAKGKTCLMRALDLVCLNRTRGKAFVRNRTGVCRVSLEVEGPHKVVRTVSKSRNEYKLDDKSFRSFGACKLPDEIGRLLRVRPINFQRQLDPVFLLSLSPGQASRALDEIVDLDVIDRVLTEVAAEVRQAGRHQEEAEDTRDEAEDQGRTVAWADAAAAGYDQCRRLHAALKTTRSKIARVRGFVSRASKSLERKRNASRAKGDARLLITLGDRLARVRRACARVDRVVKVGNLLAAVAEAKAAVAVLVEFRERADGEAAYNRDLEMRLAAAREARRRRREFRRQVRIVETELAEIQKGRCALCGRRN